MSFRFSGYTSNLSPWDPSVLSRPFSEFIELIKKTRWEDLSGLPWLISVLFIESIFFDLEEGQPIKIKKFEKDADGEDNLFYCFDDFYYGIKKIKSDNEFGRYSGYSVYSGKSNSEIKANNDLEQEKEKFFAKLKKIIEPYEFRRLNRALKDLSIENLADDINLIKSERNRLKALRTDGRPYKFFNLILSHLVDSQTIYHERKSKQSLVRNWNNVCFALLWLHFHPPSKSQPRFDEISDFINEGSIFLSTKKALSKMRKWFQTEYSNFRQQQRGYYLFDKKGGHWIPAKPVTKIVVPFEDGCKIVTF